MLFKSHLRSILNISPQSENEAKLNVVPLHTDKITSDSQSTYTNDTSNQEEDGPSSGSDNTSHLEADRKSVV